MPILEDADNDVEAHLVELEDLRNLANPRGSLMDHEKLRLSGKTLKGAKRRCYQTSIKEPRNTGEFDSAPATVLDRAIVSLKSSFNATAARAKRGATKT